MGQFSFGNEAQGGPCEGTAKSRLAPSTKSRRVSRPLPELTGDPATDQALLELAEILAEIARALTRPTTEREEER